METEGETAKMPVSGSSSDSDPRQIRPLGVGLSRFQPVPGKWAKWHQKKRTHPAYGKLLTKPIAARQRQGLMQLQAQRVRVLTVVLLCRRHRLQRSPAHRSCQQLSPCHQATPTMQWKEGKKPGSETQSPAAAQLKWDELKRFAFPHGLSKNQLPKPFQMDGQMCCTQSIDPMPIWTSCVCFFPPFLPQPMEIVRFTKL